MQHRLKQYVFFEDSMGQRLTFLLGRKQNWLICSQLADLLSLSHNYEIRISNFVIARYFLIIRTYDFIIMREE